MKFRVTQYIPDYVKVGDEYRHVEVENDYEVDNYDDLQNLLLTLIACSAKDIKFKVAKEEA